MLNNKEFVREMQLRRESAWINPDRLDAAQALTALPFTRADVDDAEDRLERFSHFIKRRFRKRRRSAASSSLRSRRSRPCAHG